MTKSQTWRIYSVMYCSEQIREEKGAKLKTVAVRKGQKDWPGGFRVIANQEERWQTPGESCDILPEQSSIFHVTETNNE